jgi:hypothetical protein
VKASSLLARGIGTAVLLAAFVSCSENLDSSAACAVLCPSVGGDIQNITLDAVSLDTTVQALAGLGAEAGLLLASRGDTLDTRVVIRFDSLPATFLPKGDSVQRIASVDSAFIQLQLDTLSIKGAGPFTIEAYDVDTTANDTSTAAILALFRPDRLISSQVYARADLKDTVKFFISNDVVLNKIQDSTSSACVPRFRSARPQTLPQRGLASFRSQAARRVIQSSSHTSRTIQSSRNPHRSRRSRTSRSAEFRLDVRTFDSIFRRALSIHRMSCERL